MCCKIHIRLQISSSLGPFEIPEILEALTSYVLLHVKSEGLFRIGGSNERVRVLQDRLLKGEQIPSDQPVQDVCTVLKRWLRKQSLLGKCARPELPPETLEDLRPTITNMPPRSVCILRHLCRFLQIVADNSASNLMDIDNLAGILGESVFVAEVKVREVVTAELLKGHTEVAKQSMKLLIENVDMLDTFVDSNFRTPERHRDRDPKKSFTTRMKSYGSALKNMTIKRSRSLSLDTKQNEFMAPQLLECEERIRLRDRRGTITQDTNELLERRQKNIARRIEQVTGAGRPAVVQICSRAASLHPMAIPCNENSTPMNGRAAVREFSLDEPQQLEWKSVPLDAVQSSHSSLAALRCRQARNIS